MMLRYTAFKDHGLPWKVHFLKKCGFICMGPYHTGMWYVFYGKRALTRRNWRKENGMA